METLAQLQAEWRATAEQYGKQNERDAYNYSRSIALCADALTPFIAREQADIKLIRGLLNDLYISRENETSYMEEASSRLKEAK